MKKIIFLLIWCVCCSAQKRNHVINNYQWNINDGSFNLTFVNNPWGTITSTDTFGFWSTSCRNVYIELIVKLITYGNMPAHIGGTRNIYDYIPGLNIYLSPSHLFILLIDSNGRVWRLTRTEALEIATLLNNQNLFNQIPTCSNLKCDCQ